MRLHRESFFRCTFSSRKSRRVAHVRAWDAEEAAQLFRAELKAEGVVERGTVQVAVLGVPDEHQDSATL